MTQLRFWLAWQRFCCWLNEGDHALNLTAAWTLPLLALVLVAIEFGA